MPAFARHMFPILLLPLFFAFACDNAEDAEAKLQDEAKADANEGLAPLDGELQEEVLPPEYTWPLELQGKAILDAAFQGQSLWVLLETDEGTKALLFEKEQRELGEEKSFSAPRLVKSLSLSEKASEALLWKERKGDSESPLSALWIEGGHLHRLSLEQGSSEEKAKRLIPEEGGFFEGPLVREAAWGSKDRSLLCFRDESSPLCLVLGEGLEILSMRPFQKRSRQVVSHISQTPTGWLLAFSYCKGKDAASDCLDQFQFQALTENGEPRGQARWMRKLAKEKRFFVPQEEGFVLIARRPSARLHSAWLVTEKGFSELPGDFSRILGGFQSEGELMLLERGHLYMEEGFPVSQIHPRTYKFPKNKNQRKDAFGERQRFPKEMRGFLPEDIDQGFMMGHDALVFSEPPQLGHVKSTVIQLSKLSPFKE